MTVSISGMRVFTPHPSIFPYTFRTFFGMLDGQTVYETAESLEEIWKIIDTDSRMIINGNAKAEDEGDDTEYE
ncbi:hypothetical protein [Sellimonas sp.]|uniref:hypothetical protein n=1 Tax=Sellimonas sp. TaxID=2021466 RepID=UPI00257D13F8|nr:hypothetical protein [Sellimonas sp.]